MERLYKFYGNIERDGDDILKDNQARPNIYTVNE